MVERAEKTIAGKETDKIREPVSGNIVPPVDIYEDGENVTLFADLPGVSKENLDVQVDRDTLKIYGKKAAENGTGWIKRAGMMRFPIRIIIVRSPSERRLTGRRLALQ